MRSVAVTATARHCDLAPAQGGFVEMQFLESGTYTFRESPFSEMERGAAGKIVVTNR